MNAPDRIAGVVLVTDRPVSNRAKETTTNYYGEPITPPEHYDGKHIANVPTIAGLPPVCSCGWTRHEVDGRWYELADHFKDMEGS